MAKSWDEQLLYEALNELRAFKLLARLQYKHHARMARGQGMPGVRRGFEHAAKACDGHADRLAERIQALNGIPIFDPAAIADLVEADRTHAKSAPTLRGMALEDLTLERKQIRMYQPLIRLIGFEDPTTTRILEDILRETEAHASLLARLLARIAPMEGPYPDCVGERLAMSFLEVRDIVTKTVGL